ncbi:MULTISPECIES: hypothetical protein [Actinomyces]|uniref:hypothetical protein n=1 Tax=Actinomyces TaxID=1654 RepID=UPI000C778A82|nr:MULTISPECIES: hypothetical protein [Actinomyces]PKY73776.1 hypothetical protein CYJ23_11750 [Actinomyces oris]QQQ58991.1 hypothetical protein JJJ14_10930 [Actinomyces sp. HMT 175]
MSPSGVVPFQEQTVTRSLAARTRVLAASAALLLAVGALAGCSDHPGQVADMHYTGLDGARHSVVISEKDVDVVVKELDSALGWENLERQGVNRSEIVNGLLQAPVLVEVGQAHGLTVTDAQIVQLVKERLGFEPRKPETLTYLRASLLNGQYQQLSQHPEQAGQQGKVALADLDKVRGTLDGDLSPRYSNKAQAWLTRTDPRLEAGNNPFGGGLQQAPQQQQQDPQQQAPQQGGQQQAPQQQAPQQQQQPQQQAPQQGGQQPADSGQTDGQGQTGQADGAAGEAGQGAEQSETSGQ